MKKQLNSLFVLLTGILVFTSSCKKETFNNPAPGVDEKSSITINKEAKVIPPGIVYVPLKIILKADVYATNGKWSKEVDIDKDSKNDFSFNISISRTSRYYQIATSIVTLNTKGDGGVLSNWEQTVLSGYPSAWLTIPVSEGTSIGIKNATYSDLSIPSTFLYWFDFGTRRGGSIIGREGQLVGMRFVTEGKTYYGWLQISVSNNGKVFTIADAAYNNMPDRAIRAGETGLENNPYRRE